MTTINGLVWGMMLRLITLGCLNAQTEDPKVALQIKGLSIGSSANQIRQVEKREANLTFNNQITYTNTTFEGATGDIRYEVEKGIIRRIEFSTNGRRETYLLLLQRLTNRYGSPQDTISNYVSWRNDSLTLQLFQYPNDVSVALRRK